MNINISDVREMLECGTATNMELTEAIEFLLRERRALGREIVRLKIAHLRRMVESIRFVLDRHLISAETEAEFERKKWRRNNRAGRFAKACLAKITELKESQCSTKS